MSRNHNRRNHFQRSRSFRRTLLSAVLAGAASLSSLGGLHADESQIEPPEDRRGGISILVHEFTPEPEAAFGPDALIASAGTHDSVPMIIPSLKIPSATPGVEPAIASTVSTASTVVQESGKFNQSVAAAVALTASQVGISLEQFLEPFAMVRTLPLQASKPAATIEAIASIETLANAAEIEEGIGSADATQQQLAEAVALNRWWLDEGMVNENDSEILETEVVSDIASELAELASEEPLDVVIEEETCETVCPAESIALVETDALVGSAPVIITIQDAYLPYDLAARDLKLDAMNLSTVVPMNEDNYVVAADEVEPAAPPVVSLDLPAEPVQSAFAVADDEEVVNQEASEESVQADGLLVGNPECLLDQAFYRAGEALEQTVSLDELFAQMGKEYGSFLSEIAPQDSHEAQVAEASTEVETVDVDSLAIAEEAGNVEVEVAMMEVAGESIPAPIEDPAADAPLPVNVAMMDVGGESIPLPVEDPAADAPLPVEVAQMQVDGELIPLPVADPNVDLAPTVQLAQSELMEVNGDVIPAPFADPIANQLPLDQVVQAITDWQQDVIASLLAGEADEQIAEAPSESQQR